MKHLTTTLITLSLVALLLGACVPAPAPVASSGAAPVATEPAPAGEWQTYTNAEVGFSIQMPPTWSQQTLPDQNNGAIHGMAFTGPEGGVEVYWGVGFGGACPSGTEPVQLAQGELPACHVTNSDGTETWSQIGYEVGGGNSFSVRAYTGNAEPSSHDLVLQVLATLTFMPPAQPQAGAAIANPASENCVKQGGTLEIRDEPAARSATASSLMAPSAKNGLFFAAIVRRWQQVRRICHPPPELRITERDLKLRYRKPAAQMRQGLHLRGWLSATPGASTAASANHAVAAPPRRRDHPAAARRGLQRPGAGDGPCVGCDGCDAVRRAHQRSRHWRERHRLHGNGHRHRRAVREPGCGGEDAGQPCWWNRAGPRTRCWRPAARTPSTRGIARATRSAGPAPVGSRMIPPTARRTSRFQPVP